MKVTKVGIIGCGNISGAYLNCVKQFPNIEIAAVADINMEAAQAKAEEFEIKAVTVDEILADKEIEIIVNLTIPQAHASVNIQALNAGKHVHCEKPFAVTLEEGQEVLKLAKEKNLYVGCAPDTFLGGGIQTCRKLIDDNWIGKPISGTAFMMCPGHESWHPNPGFYYLNGGGPLFDMGPYYITALINLLGPIKRVCASTGKGFEKRVCTAESTNGTILPVETATHLTGILDFECGTVITMTMSFDVQKHFHKNIEIYGTEGSLVVPDPNGFGGEILLSTYKGDWKEMPYSHKFTDNARIFGVSDMADAIKNGRINRCSGELAYHVLEVMHAFQKSSDSGCHVNIESTCEQPEALSS
ncbi:MAG: Gfo/Idh/MocA family oxidoreductase [Kiritimatiellae bacterium]|jgi:predicted dehydrogenase|nr:Gfo/Idh/MocA family oxidoreductase [Kiritimatiellia bacterium]